MDEKEKCMCGSGRSYDLCCGIFHNGILPSNALELMRSRFSAYALNLPDFIIATTHPASPEYSENLFSWRRAISSFSKSSHFRKLQILDFKENGSIATVVFTAYIDKQGEDCTFTELSFFEKSGGRWLYKSGKMAAGHAPELVSEEQLKILPLAYYGEPVLRRKADKVEESSSGLRKLVDEMVATMDSCDGIGLAAPQVHHSKRLFIIRTPNEKSEEEVEFGEVKVFVNPEILFYGDEKWSTEEGCLSIPGIRASVRRPKMIRMRYQDLDGALHEEEFSGWKARVIQHEYDHIEGVLFIDRLEGKEALEAKAALAILANRMKDHRNL